MKMVLIADDSPVIRKVGRRLLEDMGFVVVDAQNTVEAIEICRDSMPDVVILDHDMPGRDTLDAIAEISRVAGERQVSILYCLTEMVVPEMAKAKRAGACGFLMKPFDREVVIERFAEAGIELPNRQAA